jgi:hypothetical protein
MTILEKAVIGLATALETLESKLEGQLDNVSANGELIGAARRQARVAQDHTASASRDLSSSIDDLKTLLDDYNTNSKG